MNNCYKYFVLIVSVTIFIEKSKCTINELSNDGEYVAAVVEYSPDFIFGDPKKLYEYSVEQYAQYIHETFQMIDIIVFPEFGLISSAFPTTREAIATLATIIPPPESKIIPCGKSELYSKHLCDLSCAVSSNRVYVVVNLIEFVDCIKNETNNKCTSNNTQYYNTNVVFDRTGTVIARYRKYNIFKFAERGFDITETPDIVTFETDFNVTFGMIIRHDILFENPALTLIREENIYNIIYSTSWVSTLPFLTAIQLQAGWAYSNNITLLASGYNDALNGIGGSGIYVGKAGIIQANFPFERHCDFWRTARIPKSPYSQNVGKLLEKQYVTPSCNKKDELNLRREDLSEYITEIVSPNYQQRLCYNDLCCEFEIKHIAKDKQAYIYRAVILNGLRKYHHEADIKMGVQICGIINCVDRNIESCGLRNRTHKTGNKFTKIIISGNFRKHENTLQWPSIVNTHLLPLEPLFFKFENSKKVTNLSLNTKQVDDLLTFAIYGRDYTLDQQDYKLDEQNYKVDEDYIRLNHLSPFKNTRFVKDQTLSNLNIKKLKPKIPNYRLPYFIEPNF